MFSNPLLTQDFKFKFELINGNNNFVEMSVWDKSGIDMTASLTKNQRVVLAQNYMFALGYVYDIRYEN